MIGDRDAKKIGRQEASALLAERHLSEHGKRTEGQAREDLAAFDPELVETTRFIIPVIPEVRESMSGREWRPWSRLIAEMQILGGDERSSETLNYLQQGKQPKRRSCSCCSRPRGDSCHEIIGIGSWTGLLTGKIH